MRFLYNSFKAKKKQIVKVSVSRSTKVKLMTAFDLKKYKQGRTHRYRGGFFESSPIIFRLPADGVWYVVVEKGTHSEPFEVEASVQLLPPDKKQTESTASDAPKNLAPIKEPEEQTEIEADTSGSDEQDEEVEEESEKEQA